VAPARKKTTARSRSTRTTRTLSVAHKRALAEGRTMSATVDRYLAAINTPKKRGRKVSRAMLEQRLLKAREQYNTTTGVMKLLAAQEIRDLEARLARRDASTGVDAKALEAAFIKIAKRFGENRGIGYGSWRDAGVPVSVLKRAGVLRSRTAATAGR
jgi:hypothetical protein